MTKYKFLAVLFFLIFFCGVASLSAYAENDFLSSINAHLERLESRYQISFKYKDFPRHTDYLKFSEVSVDEYHFLNEYLSLFEEEINKYPSGFFKDRNVRGIGLVTHLFMGQRSAQGLYGPKVSVMFFDISRFGSNKARQRHGIHHEIFHMMFQKRGDSPLLSDEEWTSFNGSNFSYGKQTKPLSESNPYNHYAPNQLGFVTYYAMESIREDQAEVFACLMFEPHRKLIEKWILKDPAMAKKVEAIKEFSKYYHPQMDEAYWDSE